MDVATPHGLARAHVERPSGEPLGALVLGHGAGGSITAPDLQAVRAAALEDGWAVALVEQPYRVAGRRSPPPAPRLDAAWIAVLAHLRGAPLAGLDIVCGGRSSGARVACRTAAQVDARAVVCLAFPLRPPGDRPSRLPELEAVDVPVLVVQGASDRFGVPPADPPRRSVTVITGDHALRSAGASDAAAAVVRDWLSAPTWRDPSRGACRAP